MLAWRLAIAATELWTGKKQPMAWKISKEPVLDAGLELVHRGVDLEFWHLREMIWLRLLYHSSYAECAKPTLAYTRGSAIAVARCSGRGLALP